MTEKLTIGIKEAAKLIDKHPQTVYSMTTMKGFPGKKRGKFWYINRQRFLDWIAG